MNSRSTGRIRRSQVITTYGPGALIDLPRDSAVVAGIDGWGGATLESVDEPRVRRILSRMTGVQNPHLRVPPTPDPAAYWQASPKGIDACRFPEWFVVQEPPSAIRVPGSPDTPRSRRLVHRQHLDDRRKYDSRPVVATRFVVACTRGHVVDFPWCEFVHGEPTQCLGQLWLDETGATGELANLRVRCSCGKSRSMTEANEFGAEPPPLGYCTGARPWLGPDAGTDCNQRDRLLIRTATNAYFPLLVRALSIPDTRSLIDQRVAELWDVLSIVTNAAQLGFIKQYPKVAAGLHGLDDTDVIDAIERRRTGDTGDRSIKEAEIEALLAVPEGFGDDVPINPDFHARKLRPEPGSDRFGQFVETVVQVHRLREVLALGGFTRLEAPMPDIDGVYRDDVERADISVDPSWFPAVENRGEGVLVHFASDAIHDWRKRPAVRHRINDLKTGRARWAHGRKHPPDFPGGVYVMLHTFSHMLLQSISDSCGYPAASIRERVYVDKASERYGVLLYTSSPDAEGTLGGLLQQARHIHDHIERALRTAALCSNDPVCSQHSPAESIEERWLHGAACHGCALVAETSCEMRNDYLDRALVVPTLSERDAAFFPSEGWP